MQRIKTPETGTKRPLWASSITCAGVSSVRIATGHLGARARAQRRRHSPFAVDHRNHPGIFAPTTPSHGLPLHESPSSLPCGFLSPSSWRPASKSAFLLRLPHLYRSSLCVSESLPRPHHSPSLGPSPFSKRLVLCRATAALPNTTQHNRRTVRHRPTTKPRARPVGNISSPPTKTFSPPRRLPSLHSPSADSPISPREPQSQLPAMSRTTMPTGAKTRLMSELKTLCKENWINFEDVS